MQRVTLAFFTLAAALSLLLLSVANAMGADRIKSAPPAPADTVPLPQTTTVGAWSDGEHFHVDPATTKDLDGVATRGIPAWTITILDGVGDWVGPSHLSPPQFLLNSPAEIRNKLALYQVESGLEGGWIAVPKGWRVLRAAAGAQGSWGVVFTAPGGPMDGY